MQDLADYLKYALFIERAGRRIVSACLVGKHVFEIFVNHVERVAFDGGFRKVALLAVAFKKRRL